MYFAMIGVIKDRTAENRRYFCLRLINPDKISLSFHSLLLGFYGNFTGKGRVDGVRVIGSN